MMKRPPLHSKPRPLSSDNEAVKTQHAKDSPPLRGPCIVPPRVRQRSRRACEPCRLKKIKCSGNYPCATCKNRQALCLPSTEERRSRRKPSTGVDIGSSNANPGSGTGLHPQQGHDPTDYEVHCSITGFDALNSSQMQLYYGPSSAFAFLQQLHAFLSDYPSVKDIIKTNQHTNYTAEAIANFGYKDLFFGTHFDDQINRLSSLESASMLVLLPITMLDRNTADLFLAMFFSSTHHTLPFCTKETLQHILWTMYADSSNFCQNPDSTLMTAVLAIGATLTDERLWADCLYKIAKFELSRLGEAVNIRAVQTTMLLAELSYYQGRPNSANLYVGTAVNKALAVGLHRDDSRSCVYSQGGIPGKELTCMQERRATFWSLYAQDRKVSLSIGRPAAINDMDVAISDPEELPHLNALVALSRISNKIYYDIYSSKRGTLAAFCGKVRSLREDLLQFHDGLTSDNIFPISEAELQDSKVELTTIQMLTAFDFFQTMIITLRPCLVLSAVAHRETSKDTNKTVPAEWVQWLDETSTLCSRVASHVISLFSRAIRTTPTIKRLRHSRFFLEGACFILLFNVIRDPSGQSCEWSLKAVSDGLQCFSQLSADKLLNISIQGVEQILLSTRELMARANNQNNHTLAPLNTSLVEQMGPGNNSEQLQPSVLTQLGNCGSSHDLIDTYQGPELGFVEDCFHYTGQSQPDQSDGMTSQDCVEVEFFDLGYYLWTEGHMGNNNDL